MSGQCGQCTQSSFENKNTACVRWTPSATEEGWAQSQEDTWKDNSWEAADGATQNPEEAPQHEQQEAAGQNAQAAQDFQNDEAWGSAW